MNANELADYLENDFQIQEAVIDMLRQQQAEIEALKANFNKENPVKEVFNTEPVAWGYKDSNGDICDCICPEEHERAEGDYTIPLYTHPAKTLTDEEILNVAFCCEVHTVSIENDWDGTVIDFARAILRKAQEK